MGCILSIYQCVCKISSQYSTQFKRWGHFHFFRIWSSAKPRRMKYFAISWARSCQYQCIRNSLSKYSTYCQYQFVCKILSKCFKRFKSNRHFLRTSRGQNLHKQAGDKIFTNSPFKIGSIGVVDVRNIPVVKTFTRNLQYQNLMEGLP